MNRPLQCPFCGGIPKVEPWHGGGPDKHLVHCTTLRCHVGPGCSGETKDQAVNRWNRRAKPRV
jgi:hypothetical protein